MKESRCFFIEQLIRKYPISEYDKGTEKTAAVKTLEKRNQEETILTAILLAIRLLD